MSAHSNLVPRAFPLEDWEKTLGTKLGKKKSLGHAQLGLLQGFNAKFSDAQPHAFHMRVPPPPGFDKHHAIETGPCGSLVDFLPIEDAQLLLEKN